MESNARSHIDAPGRSAVYLSSADLVSDSTRRVTCVPLAQWVDPSTYSVHLTNHSGGYMNSYEPEPVTRSLNVADPCVAPNVHATGLDFKMHSMLDPKSSHLSTFPYSPVAYGQSTSKTFASHISSPPRPALVAPPPAPSHLDRNHFRTLAGVDASLLRRRVEDCCCEQQADWEFCAEQFSYHCVAYYRQAEVRFWLNLFTDLSLVDSVTGQPGFIIELQHMMGCRFGFMDIVKGFTYYMQETGVIPGGSGACSGPMQKLCEMRAAACAGGVILPTLDVAPVVVAETVRTCLAMMRCQYLDVKTEALCTLASMSCQDGVQQALLDEPGCIDELLVLTQAATPAVHRCAVTVLSNLLDKTYADQVAARLLQEQALAKLGQLVLSSETPQVFRESARCLEKLCSLSTDQVLPQLPAVEAALAKLESIGARCRTVARAIGVIRMHQRPTQ